MSAEQTGGLPPGLKALLAKSLAEKFPDMDIKIHELGGAAQAETDSDAPSPTDDGFRDHRAELIDKVLDNMGEEHMTAQQVVWAAETMFQYIMHGTVPE